jgi:hypothetical protein
MVSIQFTTLIAMVAILVGCTPIKPLENTTEPSSKGEVKQQVGFDISRTFYRSVKDVDKVLGKSTGGHKLKADSSNRGRTPGELREYAEGKDLKYALARFFKGKCVSVQLELTEPFERPEDALTSVGLDVTPFLAFAEESILATRWRTKKLGNYLFKDVSAFRLESNGKFYIVQFELVDPD